MTKSTYPWGLCLLLVMMGCNPSTETENSSAAHSQSRPLVNPPSTPEVVPAEPDFERLILSDFTAFQADDGTWTSEGGMLICSGVPKGYLYSKKIFENLTLRGEFQFVLTEEQMKQVEKANTGIMLAIQEPHRIWPVSLEVQGRYDLMGSINANGGIPPLMVSDAPDVRERVRLPADQWNSLEITVKDGAVTSRLNGEIVCTSQPTDLKSGPIGLQAEGYVVRFRNLRIRRDSATRSSEGTGSPKPSL